MDDAGWSPRSLAEARERIDAIDAQMLALLHDRAQVVEHVGRLKRESGGAGAANAFRPAREVAMMRAMQGQTHAPLAFATVLAVWREMISGFTAAQMPLQVVTVESAMMLARDTFGAQAQIRALPSAHDCLAALAQRPGTVILLPDAGIDWPAVVESGAQVVAAAPFAGARIEAWCLTDAAPEASGEDITLALTPTGTLRHIPGFQAETGTDTPLGGYPVPLQTG